MSVRSLLVILCAFILFGFSKWAWNYHRSSQEQKQFRADYDRRLASSPRDLTITLSTQDGQKRFRIGEVIRMRVRYSSPSEAYVYETPYFWWSDMENSALHVDNNDGWVDPLNDYYACGCGHLAGSSAMSHKT